MYFFLLTKKSHLLVSGILIVATLFAIITFATSNGKAEKTFLNEKCEVPIIMYHSLLENKNSFGKYVISPQLFESDMKYLKDSGYTTIFVNDLIQYVYNDAALPKKPIIVTLDDGYYNNLVYVLPILQKYDMKASIAVVGAFTDKFSKQDSHNVNYSHLTWEDIKQLTKSKNIEISNHTYDMHKLEIRRGCFKKKSESDCEYKKVLKDDIGKLQSALLENAQINCNVFTYPYGLITNASVDIIKEMGFKSSLSCYERINIITKDKDCLFNLGRFNRPYGITTENFMEKRGI